VKKGGLRRGARLKRLALPPSLRTDAPLGWAPVGLKARPPNRLGGLFGGGEGEIETVSGRIAKINMGCVCFHDGKLTA